MTCYRVNVLVQDPEDVFTWIRNHVAEDQVIRHVGFKIRDGWFMKVVFKRQVDAELFHTVWIPEADSHEVPPFGQRNPA